MILDIFIQKHLLTPIKVPFNVAINPSSTETLRNPTTGSYLFTSYFQQVKEDEAGIEKKTIERERERKKKGVGSFISSSSSLPPASLFLSDRDPEFRIPK